MGVDENQSKEDQVKVDILREPPLRYLGYANEVGEAFRSQVHVKFVRASYGVATGYVIADAIDKGRQAAQKTWPSDKVRNNRIWWAIIDTLAWQGLASVAVPGLTINRLCALTGRILRKSTQLSPPVQRWITTGIGLASIPFIIKPIDHSVDWFMESTLRTYYHYEGPVMKQVLKHHRND